MNLPQTHFLDDGFVGFCAKIVLTLLGLNIWVCNYSYCLILPKKERCLILIFNGGGGVWAESCANYARQNLVVFSCNSKL